MSDENISAVVVNLKQQIKQLSLDVVDIRLSIVNIAKHMITTQKDIDNLYNAGNELVKAVRLLIEEEVKDE